MNTASCIEEILRKIGALPEGFTATASYYIPELGWMICIRGTYAGQSWDVTRLVSERELAFLSAVRDRLMVQHWGRMKLMSQGQPDDRRSWFQQMVPYSQMEMLNYAAY